MFEMQYIRQNAPSIVENCIRQYLWNNSTFRDTTRRCVENSLQYGISAIALETYVYNLLNTISNPAGLKKFVNARRAITVSPAYKNANDYIRYEWETNFPLEYIADIVAREVSR